jgi:hypothetical protein
VISLFSSLANAGTTDHDHIEALCRRARLAQLHERGAGLDEAGGLGVV